MTIKLKSSIFRGASFLGGALLLLSSVAACTATVTAGGTGGTSTCSTNSTVAGCGAAQGYSCTGADTPEGIDSNLSCGMGTSAGSATDYCCTTVGVGATDCAANPNVPCTSGTGYLCPSGAIPSATALSCGKGVDEGSGNTGYCCNPAATGTSTCGADTTVPCPSGGTGYSCTGSATPGTSLNCGGGQSEPNGSTGYCCNPTTTTTPMCAADTTVPCTSGSGYSCTGGMTPDASLTCGAGLAETNGATSYCCTTGTATTPTCAADTTVSCTSGSGYSCTGGAVPATSLPTLSCGAGTTESSGATGYCCSAPATSTCMPNTGVTCSATGATGYSCSGADTPSQATANLLCETVGNTGGTSYCCITSGNSCVQALAITDCTSGAYGVTCTGTDNAMGANAALACAPDTGNPAAFCCTTL